MGDRVCVDLCSLLRPGEGMLVGSFARALFLVHSEVCQTLQPAEGSSRVVLLLSVCPQPAHTRPSMAGFRHLPVAAVCRSRRHSMPLPPTVLDLTLLPLRPPAVLC